MRRWLDMIAAHQPVRRIAIDAGLHAMARLANVLPPMRQRMSTARLFEDLEYARPGGTALHLDVLQPLGPGPHPVLI